jgi:hypothetical protein
MRHFGKLPGIHATRRQAGIAGATLIYRPTDQLPDMI